MRPDASARRVSPACAGNICRSVSATATGSGQPRVCGEYTLTQTGTAIENGSAPRVRGIRTGTVRDGTREWGSPACAGNTRRRPPSGGDLRGQPRMRGEYCCHRLAAVCISGLAPRVRGIRLELVRTVHRYGISPACAGNTAAGGPLDGSREDQPRMRGIRADAHTHVDTRGISPARAGMHAGVRLPLPLLRVSPACAGNTNPHAWSRTPSWGQPRVCGEYRTPFAANWAVVGSAPRVRGILRRAVGRPDARGVSPACAGNTLPVSAVFRRSAA